LPPPFGLARNGLVAYGSGGDILIVDPVTGARRVIVPGVSTDTAPIFSPTGTRIAFMRRFDARVDAADLVVIVDADGANELVAEGPLAGIDTDARAWSPDGRWIAVGSAATGGVHLVDTATGAIRRLAVEYFGFELFWRPPFGRQLLYTGGTEEQTLVFLVEVFDDGTAGEPVQLPFATRPQELRAAGFTPDGRFAAAAYGDESLADMRTSLLDLESGRSVDLPVGFGHLSNDGTRLAGLEVGEDPRTCVIRVGDSHCRPIGDVAAAQDPTYFQGLAWSPDDRWIVVYPAGGGPPVLLDPDGGSHPQPSWVGDGAQSWQRTS
jgi:WD40 repeat protein